MSVPLQRAHDMFMTLMTLLVGIFAVLFILLNLLLHFVIVRPLVRMSRLATDIASGSRMCRSSTSAGLTRLPRCRHPSIGCDAVLRGR
jgi:hypothetical protein